MEIEPVAKGLDDGDDAGRKRASGHNFEVTCQGPEGQAAKIPQEAVKEGRIKPEEE